MTCNLVLQVLRDVHSWTGAAEHLWPHLGVDEAEEMVLTIDDLECELTAHVDLVENKRHLALSRLQP